MKGNLSYGKGFHDGYAACVQRDSCIGLLLVIAFIGIVLLE